MTAFEFLKSLHSVCHFQSREGAKVGPAGNNELKRWIKNKALIINGKAVEVHEELDFHMNSVVLFPNNPITLL